MKRNIYIFFSLLIILSPLLHCQVTADSVLIVFQTYVKLNEKFLQSVPKDSPTNLLYKENLLNVEEFCENKFSPILPYAEKIICENEDGKLLAELFKVQINTQNSANELPAYYLGKIFLFNPELFELVYNDLNVDDKLIILNVLEFGFDNVVYHYQELIKKLKSEVEKSKID
jgi:hypothetical protein